MGIFSSLGELAKDVVTIASAPVEIAIDATRIVTKEVAKMASEVVQDVKSETGVEDDFSEE